MRPRKKDRHLPPCVFHKHGAYWLVKKGKWTRLGQDLSQALAAYANRLQPRAGGMPALIEDALATILPGLAPSTANQYTDAAKKLRDIFDEFSPRDVRPVHIYEFQAGLSGIPNMCNRCLSLLRQVFVYAVKREIVDSNPCNGIPLLTTKKRGRLIEQWEFDAIREKAGPRLQVIMDLLYLTGQRVGDVLTIRYADLQEDGIAFVQQKTGAKLVVRWSQELRAVVERAKGLHGNVRALTLLHNRKGKAPDYSTIKIQWDKARTAAGIQDAHIHDIRAMSGTAIDEQGGDATALLGHTSTAMTKRYLRSKKVPKVTGPIRQALDVRQKKT